MTTWYEVGYSGRSLVADYWRIAMNEAQAIADRDGGQLLYSGHAIRTDSFPVATTYCRWLRWFGAEASIIEV